MALGAKITSADLNWSARDAAYKRMMMESATTGRTADIVQPIAPAPPPTPEETAAMTELETLNPWAVPSGTPDTVLGTQLAQPTAAVEEAPPPVRPQPLVQRQPERVISPEEKEQLDKDQIKTLLTDADTIAKFGLGDYYGNEYIKQNNIIQDFKKMSPVDFATRYGNQTYQDMAALQIGSNVIKDYAKSEKGPGESVQDIAVLTGVGATTLVSGIAALGTAAIGRTLNAASAKMGGGPVDPHSDEDALKLMHAGEQASNWLKQFRSEPSRQQAIAAELQRENDHIDQAIQYARDVKKDGKMTADFADFGRSVKDAAVRLYNNPMALEDLSSEAIGSMLGVAPITKVVGVAGEALLANRVSAATLGKIAPAMKGTAFNVAVGIQEAGGTFNDAVATIVNMSHEELVEKSPKYVELLKGGLDPEVAKTRLAVDAGLAAAPVAFATGAATSVLAPRGLELGRPGVKTLRGSLDHLARDIPREVIEETPQSGLGEAAGNWGVQQVVPSQRIGENVGEVATEGGLAAVGVGPTVKAPGLALQAAAAPFKIAAEAIRSGAAKTQAANAASSPVSEENLSAKTKVAAEQAPAIGAGLRTLLNESTTAEAVEATPGATPEVTPEPETETDETVPDNKATTDPAEVEDFIKKVESAATLQPTDLENLPGHLVQKLVEQQGGTNKPITRFDAISQMAKIIEDKKSSEDDTISAAMFIAEIINGNTDLFSRQLPKFLEDTKQDHKTFSELDEYVGILQSMQHNPIIKRALKFGEDELTMSDRDISKLKPNEITQVAKNVVNVATHAPDRLNEKLASQVLEQADAGVVDLGLNGRNLLRNAIEFGKQAAKYDTSRLPEASQVENEANELQEELKNFEAADTAAAAAATEAPKVKPKTNVTQDFVARQIENDAGDEGHKTSLRKHVSGINRAIKDKDSKTLKNRVLDLANFARSHANKVDAINTSIDSQELVDGRMRGKNIPYRALGSSGLFYNTKKGIGINVGQRGSEALAHQVHKEATTIADLANHFIGQHPELNIKPVKGPAPLNAKIVKGSSTTQQSPQATPATTSEKTVTQGTELPLTPAQGTAPAATATTTATTETSAETKPEPVVDKDDYSAEEIKNMSLEDLGKQIDRLAEKRRAKKATDKERETEHALSDERENRSKAAKPKPATPAPAPGQRIPVNTGKRGSFYTPEYLQDETKWSNEELNTEIEGLRNKPIFTRADQDTIDVIEAELARRKTKSGNQLPEVSGQTSEQAPPQTDDDLAAYEAMASEQEGMDQDSVDRFADEIAAQAAEVAAVEPMNADAAIKLIGELRTRNPTQQELVSLNKYLETLSEEEFIKVYEQGDGNVTIAPITGKAFEAVNQIVKDLSKAVGFDLSNLVRYIRSGTFKKGPAGGQFNTVGPFMLLNQNFIDLINSDKMPLGALRHLLAHEFAHAVDFHSAGVNSQDLFQSSNDPFTFDKDGPLWEQFQTLTNRPAIQKFNIPMWKYLESHIGNAEVFANEFFAELTAFVINERAIADKLIPEGVVAVEAVLSRAAANRQLPRGGTSDTQSTDRGAAEAKPAAKPKTVKVNSLADLKAGLEEKAKTEPEVELIKKPSEQPEAAEEAEPESEVKTLPEAYKRLVDTEQGNFFLKSYKRAKTLGSRLMTAPSPLEFMRNLLQDPQALADQGINKNVRPENQEVWKDYMQTALHIIYHLKTRLNKELLNTEAANGKTKVSLLTRLEEKKAVTRFMATKVLNLVEIHEDGTYGYNQQIIEAVTLAAQDWLLNVQDRKIEYDAEEIGKILGVNENQITPKILKDWNRGMDLSQAKRSLGAHLKPFLDIRDNKDISETYVQGITENMAAELLEAMKATGLLNLGHFTAPEVSDLQYGKVYFDQRKPEDQIMMRVLGKDRNTISDIALRDKLRTGRSVGEPITKVPTHQLNNPNVETTPQQKKAAGNGQAARHYTNMPMFGFMKALGLDTYVNALGGRLTDPRVTDPKKTNVNDATAKAGAYQELVNSYENMLLHVAEVEAYAARNGMEVGQVPTFFEYAILGTGRMQMRGLFNGQASKLARNIVTPTRATIDLSKPSSRKFTDWMQGIAQGLGVKTEGVSRRAAVTAAMAKIAKERPVIDALKEHLRSETKGEFSKEVRDLFTNRDAKDKFTDHGFQAILDYARYEVSRESNDGDLTKFESWNFLEADGKTNGPINALMLWSAGQISPKFLQLVAKGGMFFGVLDKTLDMHGDKVDLYRGSANRTSAFVADLLEAIRKDKATKVADQFDAFRRVMSALNVDITIVGDKIEISRGFAKNPLTITVYGSGLRGISNKAAGELVKMIYSKLSESLQTGVEPGELIYKNLPGANFNDDLAKLLGRVPGISKDKKYGNTYFTRNVTHDNQPNRPDPASEEYLRTFTFSNSEFAALRDNVEFFLTEPLVRAITEEMYKEIKPVLDVIMQATQIQSIVVQNLFQQKVFAKIADKKINPKNYPGYNDGDFLSQNELNEIYQSLNMFRALIDTGTQRYDIGSNETADVFTPADIVVNGKKHRVAMPKAFATTLTGQLETPIFMRTPGLADVSSIPIINIGSGDGQMMLHAMSIHTNKSDISQHTLPVFDGLNMPIDQILAYSQIINEAVHKTWTQNNPMRAVAENFREFARNRPIEQVLDPNGGWNKTIENTYFEMSKVYHEKKVPPSIITEADMNTMIQGLIGKLNYYADDLEVRQQVYKETTHSIDQMASGKSPYNNRGTLVIPANASLEEIAMIMEGRRLELMKAKTKATDEMMAVDTVPANTPVDQLPPAMQRVLALGAEDVSGARVVYADQLAEVVSNLNLGVFGRQLIKFIHSDYKIILGTPAQLDAYERSNNKDRFRDGSNDSPFGKIDPVARIITISNLASETILHELIHAATIDKVRAYYSNPGSLSQDDQDAIKRIEGLMNEWRLLDFTNEDQAVASAHRMAQAAVEGHWAKGREAEAVNEFMAWTLSNQHVAAKAKTIKNPLFRLAAEALEALKAWFGKSLRVPNNLLDQLRFNTRILVSTPTIVEDLQEDANAVAMYQSPAFGNNDRITYLRGKFNSLITAYLNEGDQSLQSTTQQARRANEVAAAWNASRDVLIPFVRHFPDLKNMQAWATFYSIQAVLMTDIKLNPNALARTQELYDHVISNLKLEDFRRNEDPNDQNDIRQAQGKFDAIHGLFVKKTDAYGRSSLMSSFLALSMTSETFREVLSKIEKPKADKSIAEGLDGVIETTGMAGVERMSLALSGEKSKDANVQQALDALTSHMVENIGDQRSAIELRTEGGIEAIDRYMADNIQALSEKVVTKSLDTLANSTSKAARGVAKLALVAGIAVNENRAKQAAQGLVNSLARKTGALSHEVMATVNDLVLRTDENAPVYDMISTSRAAAQQTRQRFREEVPEELASKFTRPLTDEEWTAQYKAYGNTDLPALAARLGSTGAIRAVTDVAHRNRLIRTLEASIQASEGARAAKILEKSKQLAAYLNGHGHGVNLLPNAYAIGHLRGEVGHTRAALSANLESNIDELTTLYAVQDLTQETKDAIAALGTTEQAGMEFMFDYMVGQRNDELVKAKGTLLARNNHYKGDLPSEKLVDESLVIESDTNHADMLKKGYTRVGPYGGSSADRTLSSKSYYHSPVSGLAPYRQGVMQTVHVTASGVDPQTGYTVGQLTAGRVTDGRLVGQAMRLVRNQRATNENLRFIYDDGGNAIAMERLADPVQTSTIARNTNLSEMLGAWRGRQVEEEYATGSNSALVHELYKIWDRGRRQGRSNEFVNILTSTDPVDMNIAKLIPNLMRDEIKQLFGKDTFMVHRSMVLNALGDRQASVADMFTGETRWKPEVQKKFEEIALGLFGNSAFTKLVGAERLVQNVITNAKYTIVVKSVIIPAANIISGMGQLLNRGVPLRHILTNVPKKVIEINQYIRARAMEVKLEARLRSAEGKNDLPEIRKLKGRLQALEDSYKRLSIYPLIQAGEFSAISNGEVSAEDLAQADGNWSNYMDKLIAKIPDGPLRTTARYGLVTRDTALFQALAKSVQYGDFVMKAVLYDDLVNRQTTTDPMTGNRERISSKEAIATVNQAFVPYNNLSGRGRHYLESMGLLWFYNYKLRIMKESVYLLRHHPFRALLMAGIPGLNSIDSPLDSNFATTLIDGDLGYSIGPEMAIHSWTLNPWVNAMR